MNSTNDGKDVKNSLILGQKAKTHYIELYKTLEARLSVECELGARTSLLCEAWRRVHSLCKHSATSTHPHLLSWLQRHTAQTILQSEWRQLSKHQDKHDALVAAIDFCRRECQEAFIRRECPHPQWEAQLRQRAAWFKEVIPDPWGNTVLKALLDPSGKAPSDEQIIEWLSAERGVFFVTRLRQLALSKKTEDIALSLATAIMQRVRACAPAVSDSETVKVLSTDPEKSSSSPTFTELLTMEAGFTSDVWELITDIEFVLLYSDRSKCIALAKQTPLKNGYLLVERLQCRLETSSREKRLWKNAKDVSILIAQVMVARCMVVPTCVGTARSTLYGCSRSLVKLLPGDHLTGTMAALAAPAATARHLHTLAVAVDAECKSERKPFVCELYIRAITAGMNELERLKLNKEKEYEARSAERLLSGWFTSLGSLLGTSARLAYECALTAFSLHPSSTMYERIRTAPQLQPVPVHKDIHEPALDTNSEFGSWATDSRSQTNFVKTSETLNLKKIQHQSNVLSTAILNEGEIQGLSPELCQDLIVLLSGPRVKTLSWDMDKEILLENCRSYMERTQGGTRPLTTELKYLNLDPNSFMHLPEEMDEDEGDIYYGIEKGYEHLVELQEPEEIWEHALSDPERTESFYSTENETFIAIPKGRKKGKPRRHSFSVEEEPLDPLGDLAPKTNHRSCSNERTTKGHSKERSKERKKKEGQSQDRSNSSSKSKSKKDVEKSKITNEADPITVDMMKLQQKPKKERQKREKKEKKNLQEQTPIPTGLSRLVGKKIINPNLLKTREQIRKRETETDIKNQIFISEGNDPDVLFDGLFSMDDIKSPEKTTVMATLKTNPLHSGNSSNTKILLDNAIKASPNISKTSNQCYLISNGKGKDLVRPSSATLGLTKNVNEITQNPSGCNSNSCRNEAVDEVKLGIKRLIEFRKQKSATDILSKTTPESELKQLAGQNTRENNFYKKLGLNKIESESRILPGSSKAISVPDIPKVFINKTQSQQLHHLKNEVANYLLNQNNSVKSQSHPLNNLKNPEVRQSNDQSVPKSVKSEMSGTHNNLNKFEQKLFNMFHQSESSKVTSNTPYTIPIKESISCTKHNVSRNNVSKLDKKKLQEFFKELHRSNNAGVSKPNSTISGITKDTSQIPAVSTNNSAKQMKPSAREENAPSTFARLNYMHKNSKQIDNASKQNVDHITPNKTHKTSLYSPSIKKKHNVIDTLLSRVDCTVMRKGEITSLQKKLNSKDCATSTDAINVSQNVTNKSVEPEEVVYSLELKPTLHSVPSTTQSTSTSISIPMITNCNDDQFQSLLQQSSKYLVSRPQIRSEVVMKKEINNIKPSTSPIPLNSQSLSQQLGEEVYNRVPGCPIKMQACQNVPGQTQNSVKIQSRSSSISKTKEVSSKNGTRQSSIVNSKECKSEIKKNIIPQDWESVLNDLLSHKTPSRSANNTQDLLIKKDKKQMPSNNLCDQRVNHMNCKTMNNVSVASGKLDKDLCNNISTKQNKHVTQQKSSIFEETNKTSTKNNTTSLLYTSNTSEVVNQPLTLKSKEYSSNKKPKQTTNIKRLAKTPVIKLPYKKVFSINGSPIPTNPVISALPSWEYDLLAELMDDELRQELGEIPSDGEGISASKGKIKSFSNKVNMLGCPDSAYNLNILQNSNNQTVSILQSDMEGPEPQAIPTITGYETQNAIKSKPLHDTVFLQNDENCQTTSNEAKMYNIINPAPCMPSIVQQHQGQQFLDTSNSTTNQSLIIGTTSNCSSLDCNIQQSGINCNNQNLVSDDISQRTLVDMNNENVFNAVPQQHPPVKNVVLIRPEIVYDPYSVQVHQISNPINSDCNLNSNTYVALNAVPTISMFGAQFASPVVNPLLMHKNITVPITQETTSLAVNNGNDSNNMCSNPHLYAANGANVSNTENNYYSGESNNFDKECFGSLDDNTISLQLHSLNEENTIIDNLVSDIANVNDSISGNIFEGNALTLLPEKETVQIPYAIRSDITESEKPTSVNCQNSNDLNSTSHILSENLQTINDTDIFNSDTEIRFEDYFINYNPEKRKFDTVQEKLNDNIPRSVNDTDLENTAAKCGMPSDSGSIPRNFQNVPDNSVSCLLNVNCTMLGDADTSCPKTDVNISDSYISESNIIGSGFQSNMPEILQSESRKSDPLSECCLMVNDVISPYPQTDGNLNDVVSNNKSDERDLFPELHNNSILSYLNIQSTDDELDPIKSAEYNAFINELSQIQSPTMYSNSYLLTDQHTITADSINYNSKSNVNLNESPSNKNCEKKVISEVQENLGIVWPEKPISAEDEIRKELLKAREERMIRKKTAILNRQVHIISDIEPIPLNYASINTIETVPDCVQGHNINTGIDDYVNNKKMQSSTVYTNNCSTVKDLLFDKKDNCTDKSLPCNTIETDSKESRTLQSIHTDSSKENYGYNTIDCERFRSSIEEIDTTLIIAHKEKLDDKNWRSKARLKQRKTEYVLNGNKFKATKRLTKQNGRKITSNKVNAVKPLTDKTLDKEEQFRGSLISKQDSELTNNKDNVQSYITVLNKNDTYSVNDYENFNSKSGDETIYKTNVLKHDRFGKGTTKVGKLENNGKKYIKRAPPVKSKVSCDPIQGIKNRALISNELKNINSDNSNDESKEISTNSQKLLQYKQRLSTDQLEVIEDEDTNLNLPIREKSRREILGHNKIIDSYRDNIIIEELPNKKDDDPLKRCISVKLANGNSFKATVSGKLQVDINSLFEDPKIRSVLKNNANRNRCVLNVQQIISPSGESIKTRVLSPKPKYLETINLISDDEEDILSPESQVFNTEFGKYKIRGLHDNVFNVHQRKLSQKCFVKLQKCDIPITSREIVKTNEVKDANMSSVTKGVNEPMLPENIKSNKDNKFADDKNVPVIEIDDSSNDSADTNNKSVNITQSVNIPSDSQLNIKELKDTLLKDLCVDVVTKTIDTNITELSVPIDILTDLENLKGKLLKDLCDDLGKIENEKEISTIADVVSDLKGVGHNTLQNASVASTNSDNSTECSLKNTENLFVDPVSCMNVCPLHPVPIVKPIFPNFTNELIPPKKCQLIIEKCDGLAKKYRLMRSKRCFVALERCDNLIDSQTRTKSEQGKPENDNQDEQKSNNSDTSCLTDIDAFNCNLQRCGSFSILNELDLCDQTVKLLKTTEHTINDKLMFYKRNMQNGKIGKIYADLYTCQSEWLMTKSRHHWMLKQILYSSIIPDDISTDCESDRDDNCTDFSGAFINGLESGALAKQNILYEVPSLVQIALKFYSTPDENKSHETKSSRTSSSLDHLKRKLPENLPESNTSSDSKYMKFYDYREIKTSLVDSLDIKKTIFNFNQRQKCDNEFVYHTSAGNNIRRNEYNCNTNKIEECGQARKMIKTSNNCSERDSNHREHNLVHLYENTAPTSDIPTYISSKENKTASGMNFNKQSDKEVLDQVDLMPRKVVENEKFLIDLQENNMLRGNDTKKICDRNEFSNIDKKYFTVDENSKMITEDKIKISEGVDDVGLNASISNVVTISETEQCKYNILTRCMDIEVNVTKNCTCSEKIGLNSAVLDIQRKGDNYHKDDQVFLNNVVDMKFGNKYLGNSDSCHFKKEMLNIDSISKNIQQCEKRETEEKALLNEINECFVSTYNNKENFAVFKGAEGTTNVDISPPILDTIQIKNNDNKTKDLSSAKSDLSGNFDLLLSDKSTLLSNKKRIHGEIETKTKNIDIAKDLEYKLKSPNMDDMQHDVREVKTSVDLQTKIHVSQPQYMKSKNQEGIDERNSPIVHEVISSQIVTDATSNKEGSLSLYYNSDSKSTNSNLYETLNCGGITNKSQITILAGDQCSDATDSILNNVTENNELEQNKINNYSVTNDTQSNNCMVKKPQKKDPTILNQKSIAGNDKDTFEHEEKRIVYETDLRKNYCLPVSSDNNIDDRTDDTDRTCYDKDKDVRENKIDGTPCPKSITLLYESDSKVVLNGSIIKDPIVGTCYVFPIINTDIHRPVVNNYNDNIGQDQRITPDIRSDLIKDTDLIVTKPIFTYSKGDLDFKYCSKNFAANDKVSRRSTKRKIDSVESKITYKKYRKGKNIDHPKVTVTALHDFCYSKEFKNLSNYCDSIKFSYTKQYHLIQLDDVHTLLKDWPIKEESNLSTSNVSDTECHLFVDIDQRTSLPDPMEQTLAEEILAIYEEKESTSPVINETNFSMGFGEGSGRVEQNLMDGKESTKISAVTLSDVKHCQPFLQSVDNTKSNVLEFGDSKEKQRRILDKCYSYIRLRDQVQSFFRKTTAELHYSWLKDNFKSGKRNFSSYDLCDNFTNFPFDLNNSDFFEAPFVENIVQVVQIGQLPLSTGVQNPVTCDPRVTQVTDASPPQCSVENDEHDDIEPAIKAEYTELTTADISLPLMRDYDQHHQGLTVIPNCNPPVSNDNITIETEVKIEVLDDVPENEDEQGRYDTKDFQTFSDDQTNTDYSFDDNDIKVQIKTEEPDVKIIFEPVEGNVDISQIPETYEIQEPQQNLPPEKPDQLAHAMSAAGITTTPEPIPETAMDLSNSLSRTMCTETDVNNYQRSNITAMALQHALAQILPSSVNQPTECESNPQVSVASQILHIVHGKNGSLNQLSLNDNTQQSVISTATPTPVLHIVQSKNGPTSSSSNGSPVHSSNSYGGLSLVDTGLSQGGNQLLQIVNTGNQKSNNGAQLLKRVNLLTNLTNAQGSNEQKMVQFVCKSADAKGIQLNTNQRSMVLRLHTIESSQSTTKPESQEQTSSDCPTKESVVPQELKSRSVYEENYAKFIQNSKQPVIEKSTSLPKFNQAFGKPVFQEDNQKSNEIETSNAHLSSEVNIESNDCQTTDNSVHLDSIRQIASPPLLLRKSSTQTTAQQNLVQQIKQAITPMNIQTMHGGVIYTRQIPVNIGGGQTINLITVPSTERIDESAQKQKTDVRSRNEIEPSIIKIVPQSPASSNSEISTEESGVSSENSQNSQAPPMLTQMRIKLPMLSKNPQMVSAARVVRPSFFQIQRNVIGGPNQPVYQQLVLTAAPTLGQQSIRLPHAQTSREIKVGTESQTPPESQMSSSTLEQLREFDMVLEQVKERSTVQPNGNPNHDFSKSHIPSTETSNNVTRSTPSEVTQQVLYSIGNNQSVNVAYVNRKSTVVSTSATTSFARSPDSSNVVQSPTTSSQAPSSHASHTVTSVSTNGTHSQINHHKVGKVPSKSKSRHKSHHPQFKINSLPPKPSNQKPMEDEQTTQRILYILAEYKEQVENSPDKDKPAPRRRTNLQASVTPPGGSKRKKSGSRRTGRDSSPLDDNCRTMGSEDSSCGTSQGDCNDTCQDLHSPQGSPRKVAKKLSFDQDPPISQSRSQPHPTQPPPQSLQSQIHKQSQPQLQRNVLVTDGPTIAVTRAAPGKPATAVLMPANYILPVSMVKSGQQIAIVTNRGPKILTVGGGEGGATNALLLQRLISPSGLKPVLARPGVRHVRLPTTALHNLQTFNLATAANAHQPAETVTSPVPATSPPELIDAKAPRSPWTTRESEAAKPEKDTSLERPEREQEPEQEPEPEPEPDPDPDPEPWNVPHDYSYEETVRTEMDRTVLDAIPDRYSPDMEAQRIFDKMFDVESKKGYIDSQDDSPRCHYDIDASDCDDKAYHQVVQRRDGVTNRHRFISAATLRQKFALMEDELRLQKSLSEECEDLGVDSPSASDLFPEAELLFSSSPAHEVSQHAHTPQPVILNQSNGISKSDLDDHAAADQVISREDHRDDRQTDEIDLGLEDVGIVTVSEDGMRATISLDHEEFVRSHPNTTFHSELTEEGEVQPVTLADLKARHITSAIFHAGRAPATVLVTTPQTTVISQATPDGAGVDHVRCSHADSIHHEGVNRFDGVARFDVLNDSRETSNTTSAIIHSTGNATQVIRRVCYERNTRYFLDDDLMNDPKMDDRDTTLESDDRSSPERHSELFWDSSRRREIRRLDFSSDSDKCCKSPYDDHNSTDSSMGVNMRLDSVIKDARGIDRSDSSIDETNLPPLRTYPPKRTYHHDGHRTISGRKAEGRFADGSESKRRASNRGVVKRGCHCCNGTPAPPKPKKPRHKKPTLDFN